MGCRPIGYAVAATCDEPGCNAPIDRGLAYACGEMHGPEDRDGEPCCEGYFCPAHRVGTYCQRCAPAHRPTEEVHP